jgi:hypothetical protein
MNDILNAVNPTTLDGVVLLVLGMWCVFMPLFLLVYLLKSRWQNMMRVSKERQQFLLTYAADGIVEFVEDGVHASVITREEALWIYERLGRLASIKDLLKPGQKTKEEVKKQQKAWNTIKQLQSTIL